MKSRLIDLSDNGWATAEVCDTEDGPQLIINDRQMKSIALDLELARKLYAALRTFDSEGLLDP